MHNLHTFRGIITKTKNLKKKKIKTGTKSWEAGNENILPPYWITYWISSVSSHYWQRILTFPTLSNCFKGVSLCSSLKYSTSYLAVIRNRILSTYSMASVKKTPFLRMWRQRKVFLSLDIIGWTMIKLDKTCLQTCADTKIWWRGKGLCSHQKYFSLSYSFIRRGKIKCCHPIFVVSWEPFQNISFTARADKGGKKGEMQ